MWLKKSILIIVCSTTILLQNCGEEERINCNNNATVVNFTGLDDCAGLALHLHSGTNLQIHSIPKGTSPFIAGEEVKVNYTLTGTSNACNLGLVADITCVEHLRTPTIRKVLSDRIESSRTNPEICRTLYKVEEYISSTTNQRMYKFLFNVNTNCADMIGVEWLDAQGEYLCSEGGFGGNLCATIYAQNPLFTKNIYPY